MKLVYVKVPIYFFMEYLVGKWADGSFDGKRSESPMDTRNARGITGALQAFYRILNQVIDLQNVYYSSVVH